MSTAPRQDEAAREPCVFPALRADRPAVTQRETYTKTLTAPSLYSDSIYQLAFALLLKTYVRTNLISYALITHADSPLAFITTQLDDSATLSDNLQKLSTHHDSIANGHVHEHVNSALCLAPIETATAFLGSSTLLLHVDAGRATLCFTTLLCDQASARNVLATFDSILLAIADHFHLPLACVDLISTHDKQQMSAWNTAVPSQLNQTLNQVFETVFREHANKEAVYTTQGSFTYRQLDRLSTALAVRLIQAGVKPNSIVPICMNKSRWVTCAMVAVWKAGGALTAMEPSHPDDRLIGIVKETKARVMICDAAHAPRFQHLDLHIISDVELLAHDHSTMNDPISQTGAWRMSGVTPTDLAFIVFTSGSTGKPKGILNTHNRIISEPEYLSHNEEFGYTRDARILQFASYAYIPGTGENYRTLLHGATLCVPSETERTSDLVGFIQRSGSTRCYMTPSLLRTLSPDDVPSLLDVIVGGEPVDSDMERRWSKNRHFVQIYGSTEGGTWMKETTDSVPKSKGLVPVGCVQWLVDPQNVNKLVPVGAEGEVMLESQEMSVGYLNDPAKTSDAFIDPPAWADKSNIAAGFRYFRLGDVGRLETDGSLTVFGRADTQVKLHGHRVDLQEIESNLRTLLPERSEAVVELVKPYDAPDRQLLTAFCRLGPGRGIDERLYHDISSLILTLKRDLRKTLPEHMIPKVFMMLEDLPQNSSNKTDRKKLRTDASNMGLERLIRYTMSASGNTGGGEEPANEKEQILAQSWASVLRQNIQNIKRQDSFLALGGDSLAAIRLVPVLRSQGLCATTQDILTHPILKDMADLATYADDSAGNQGLAAASDLHVDTILPSNETIVLRATDFQEWAALVGARNGGWIDHFIYDFFGNLDLRLLQDCCQQLVATHSVLRSVFAMRGDRVSMLIPPATPIVYDVHETSEAEMESKSREIYEKHRICPLGAPIVRFDVLKNSSTRHRLIIRLSHAQYDGFTATSIGQYLRSLYLLETLPAALPFHEYVKKIQEPTSVQISEAFWKSLLRGSHMPEIVKRTKPGPPFNNTLNGEVQRSVTVPSLKHHHISQAAVFKTAWALTISALSQSQDIIFGDFVSGRQVQIPGIETVFGPCVNFIPVRVPLGGRETHLSNIKLLRQVQDDLLKVIPHEALGMRHIIQNCSDWGENARYSSIVNFINYDPGAGDEVWSSSHDGDDENQLKVKHFYEERQHDKTDLWLLCLPKGNDKDKDFSQTKQGDSFELFFRYSKEVYHSSAIDQIADMYCGVLHTLVTALDAAVVVPGIDERDRELLVPSIVV